MEVSPQIGQPLQLDEVAIVKSNGLQLQYITNPSAAVCRAAVSQNGMALQFVPVVHQICELTHRALQQNGLALQYVNPQLMSNDLITQSLHLTAVRQNGMALQYVKAAAYSDNCIPEIVYLTALKQNGRMLYLIPRPTDAMYLTAVKQCPRIFRFIPPRFRTSELLALHPEQVLATSDIHDYHLSIFNVHYNLGQ
jgi:hypothetical protein